MTQDTYKYRHDPETVSLTEKLQYLRLALSAEMKALRKERKLTQEQLGEVMGVNQSAVSKLEDPNRKSEIESIVKYLHALDADLAVAIRSEDTFVQVSDDTKYELYDVAREKDGTTKFRAQALQRPSANSKPKFQKPEEDIRSGSQSKIEVKYQNERRTFASNS